MKKYRKKPVVIEAVQFTGDNGYEIATWANANRPPMATLVVRTEGSVLLVQTLEGVMTASPGDFIIKGLKGEFYPCKPDIFAASYDIEEGDIMAGHAPKTLGNCDASGTRVNVPDVKIVGDGDAWQLLCKASSQKEGWMKSCKAMHVPYGVVIQVSTQQRNPDGSYAVAEAIQFVPSSKIEPDVNGGRKLVASV